MDNDICGFQKMVKYFERFKGSFRNEDCDLWSGKEKVLEIFFCRACEHGSMDMVKAIFLEAKNLDINSKYFSYSPLVTAAKTGNFELAEFCLHIGADPFKPQTLAGNVKATPLEIARKNGHTKLARLLEQAEKGRFSGRVKSLFWKFERNAHERGWL